MERWCVYSDPSGLIWFKKVNRNSQNMENSQNGHRQKHSIYLAITRVLTLFCTGVRWKSEYLTCFVFYPQATHDFTVNFCSKTQVQRAVHPGNKNLLELRRHFPMSISKTTNQTIQDFPPCFKYLPQVKNSPIPWSGSNIPHRSPATPWSPRASSTLGIPEQRGVWPPQGCPIPGHSLQGSSSQTIPVPLEIALGLIWLHGFALCRAQQTFTITQ